MFVKEVHTKITLYIYWRNTLVSQRRFITTTVDILQDPPSTQTNQKQIYIRYLFSATSATLTWSSMQN